MREKQSGIISYTNLEPKPNTDYIYDMDIAWIDGWSIQIEKGTIVENLIKIEPNNYTFNIKNRMEVYNCSYGWAFIENTEKNIEILKQIELETEILKQQELKISNLRNTLDRLYENN